MATGSGGADTTYTKIFVGGLPWETRRDAMRRHFEQFGEILEAVVIIDKATGRSKGYGFVTFKDPDSARRACEDPSPVIDGRRANCNLAFLGASTHHRPQPRLASQQGFRQLRPVAAPPDAPGYRVPVAAAATATGYFHHPSQYASPSDHYGYSGGYSQENMYQIGYYNAAGGGGGLPQFNPYYAATAAPGLVFPGFYNYGYPHYTQGRGGGLQQSPQMLQYYSYIAPQFLPGIPPLSTSIAGTTVTGISAASAAEQKNST